MGQLLLLLFMLRWCSLVFHLLHVDLHLVAVLVDAPRPCHFAHAPEFLVHNGQVVVGPLDGRPEGDGGVDVM